MIMGILAQEQVEEELAPRALVRGLSRVFLIMLAIGVISSCAGILIDKTQFAYSLLFGFTIVFTLGCGSLFWVILHSATDSEWGILVRRQMENLSTSLFVLPIFFAILVCAFGRDLWAWWGIGPGSDFLLDQKRAYLNVPFFVCRGFVFLISLGSLAYFLRRSSVLQDSDGQGVHTLRMRKLAIAGLPILAVSITFGAVDWLMGLDHHWFSTMWGVYIFAGSAGSSMALLVILVNWMRNRGLLRMVGAEHYHIMGKFLFAFTVFWAYVGYSQYMLIWYANIPEETIYFKVRNTEGWHILSTSLVVGRFFVPFGLLLTQYTKRSTRFLTIVSTWILVMQVTDIYVVVLPSLHRSGFAPSFMDLAAIVAVVGAAGCIVSRRIADVATFPHRDPRLAGSVSLHN